MAIASAHTTDSIADAAPIVCPSIDFTELIGGTPPSPNTRFTAIVSSRSFVGVPVPWALM